MMGQGDVIAGILSLLKLHFIFVYSGHALSSEYKPPGGIPTVRACIQAQSLNDLFAAEACGQGDHSGMHDSVPAGTRVADPVGRILQDLFFASERVW